MYYYLESSLKSTEFSSVQNKFVSPFKGTGIPEYYEQTSLNLKLYEISYRSLDRFPHIVGWSSPDSI